MREPTYNKHTGEFVGYKDDLVSLDNNFNNTDQPINKFIHHNKEINPYFMVIAQYQENMRLKYSISLGDIGRMFMLMAHANYKNTEGKMYISSGGRRVKKNRTLGSILLINSIQAKKFKYEMKKKGLLQEDEDGIYITSDIILRGSLSKTEKEQEYYIVFSKTIRNLYRIIVESENLRSANPMGLLLCTIPFIKLIHPNSSIPHGSNNMLAYMMEDKGELKPMTLRDMANELGHNVETVKKYIGSLNKAMRDSVGEYFMYKTTYEIIGIKKEKKEALIINPKITYSQGKDMDAYHGLLNVINSATNDTLDYFYLE